MKKHLFLVLFAFVASVGTMFAERVKIGDLYYNLNKTDKTAEVAYNGAGADISVVDNSLADWEALPKDKVFSAECPEGAYLLGLKGVAVYATEMYINILVEPNMEDITDLEWVPFQVFIDLDNSNATGGYGDLFTDANTDIMLEGALFAEGKPYNYNPAVFKWWGEVGGSGWEWTDPSVTHDASDNWGAIIGEGQLPVGASQYVDGKFEIQILRELLANVAVTPNADEFGIGFDILQNWDWAGVLPIGEDTEENIGGHVAKLKVKIAHASAQPSDIHAISGNVVIPASVSYEGTAYSVTNIGNWAFSGCSGLTSVTIPNSVTNIGKGAFSGCSSLTSVTLNSNTIVGKDYEYNSNIKSIFGEQVTEYILGDEITSIGWHAFEYCSSLTSVAIPNSVISIGERAFSNCSGLISVTIPNSVTSIGNYAFSECTGLTSVTIGNSVTSIGEYAFHGCSSLTSLSV